MLRAIGPVWDGNEVWLLAAGGTLYFAFPLLYASSFSGFYLPLMMVLWLLILRAIGIEFRGHVESAVWQASSTRFSASPAFCWRFFSARLWATWCAAFRWMQGYFFEPLWTNWRVGTQNGILDWYTVMCGVLALITLVVHGSLYLAIKTQGGLNDRARRVALRLWPVQVLLTIVSLMATVYAVPSVLDNYRKWPLGYLVPAVVIGSLAYLYFAYSRYNERGAFLASCVYVVGMLAGATFALYPNVLPASTGANLSLTVYNSSAGAHGLRVGLVWWTLGMLMALGYFVFVYRMFRGKVRLEKESNHGY